MRRLAIVMVLASLASAQVARPGRGRGVARDHAALEGPAADSLLRLVHEDAQQLAPVDRAAVLSRAVMSAQRIEPDLVLPWTEEIFNLAPQIPEDRRASLEWNTVQAVALHDVDAAMRLLERMDPPSKSLLDAGSDPRVLAAGSVFGQFWGRRGPRFRRDEVEDDEEDAPASAEKAQRTKKLDRMREIAAHLGTTGVYPYGAFAAPLRALKIQDPAAQETLFADLLSAFRSSPGRYADVAEFVRMLMNARSEAPAGLLREALTMAVATIDRLPTDSGPAVTFTYRSQGTSGQLNNGASMQLMRIMPLIREVDPAWAQQVLEQHQDVAQFEQSRGVAGTIVSTMSTGGNAAAGRTPQRQVAPIRAMAPNATESAKALAQQIADPAARAAANAEIAAGLASQNPQEAATYMNQATEGLAAIDDPVSQLMVVTSLARAAFETGDRASAAAYSERGFRLGEDVVRADYDANPDKPVMSLKGVGDLSNLVASGMHIDPAGTVSRVQAIRYPLLRANLLLTAADAQQNPRGGVRGSPRVTGPTAVEVMDSLQTSGSAPQSVTVETRRFVYGSDSKPQTPAAAPAKPPQ